MKAYVRDAIAWTPERGGLSAEDGLGALTRFARTVAATTERCGWPTVGSAIIVGGRDLAGASADEVVRALADRWESEVELVTAASNTVPLSLLDALLTVSERGGAWWIVADLSPGAEVVAAFDLSGDSGCALTLTRTESGTEPLNPCAGVVRLADGFGRETVSIQVGSWAVALEPASNPPISCGPRSPGR